MYLLDRKATQGSAKWNGLNTVCIKHKKFPY
jgi:hypothetical protein